MTTGRAPRRLPGVRFEVVPPPLDLRLPRMDIAVLVGLSASGPLHVPVAIEDPAHFASIFGEDAPLVYDPAAGADVLGYLGPAVRAFFQNGGRRCWVVRVAYLPVDLSHADSSRLPESDRFPIPGLLRRTINGLRPAFATARSEGSWADSCRVGADLSPGPVGFRGDPGDIDLAQLLFTLKLPSPDDVVVGDSMRAIFGDGSLTLMFTVASVTPLTVVNEQGAHRAIVRVTGRDALWLQSDLDAIPMFGPSAGAIEASFWAGPADSQIKKYPVLELPVLGPSATSGQLSLRLDLGAPPWPEAGSYLRIDWPGGELWMVIDTIELPPDAGSSLTAGGQIVSGPALSPSESAPPVVPPLARLERCAFELRVQRGEDDAARMQNLSFDPAHPRFWCSLPTDHQLFSPEEQPEETDPRLALWAESATPSRFPLSADDATASYVPVAMPLLSEYWLSAVHGSRSALARDGLAPPAGPPSPIDAAIFLDEALVGETTSSLGGAADFITYQSRAARPLRGLHAAWNIDEATLIAVPDAVHGTWQEVGQPPPPPPEPSPPEPSPIWGNFLDCALHPVGPPTLLIVDGPDASGSFTLEWSAPPEAGDGAWFELDEATRPDWADARAIYEGPKTSRTIYGRRDGAYYYRVRYTVEPNRSDWSAGLVVAVGAEPEWQLEPQLYSPATLISVQRALMRLCAARGDMLGVLALPSQYREDQAIAHISAFTSDGATPGGTVPALSGNDLGALGFGAIYHPWLVARDTSATDLRTLPPDGGMLGVIARRTIDRGAWIAPANEAASGVVALTPPIARERWLDLQSAGINLVRQEPRGYLTLSAETLSLDDDLIPINVRRLLSLLRRAALSVGSRYVFEANNAALQRLVQRTFESLLDDLFRRGAFAGASRDSAYQVVVDNQVNTPQSVDLGRFIVELKVAPSLPLSFITVRLLQSGDRSVVSEAI